MCEQVHLPQLNFPLTEWCESLPEIGDVSLADRLHPFLAQEGFCVWIVLAATEMAAGRDKITAVSALVARVPVLAVVL